jgi:antitoxin component YwqK of YwqJK toxin-antitoxin module
MVAGFKIPIIEAFNENGERRTFYALKNGELDWEEIKRRANGEPIKVSPYP